MVLVEYNYLHRANSETNTELGLKFRGNHLNYSETQTAQADCAQAGSQKINIHSTQNNHTLSLCKVEKENLIPQILKIFFVILLSYKYLDI